MVFQLVLFEVTVTTDLALEWPHTSMYLSMFKKVISHFESLVTLFTFEWPIRAMFSLVGLECIFGGEQSLVANITCEILLSMIICLVGIEVG